MNFRLLNLILLVVFSTLTLKATPPKPPLGYRWVLQDAFSDEFNEEALDIEKWFDHYPGWVGRSPARFEPQALSLQNGKLEIKSGVLEEPTDKFTMYGGAIVSKSEKAHFGYYECCFKASRIGMSTTFWLSNGKVPFEEGDCINDSYSQELDIQECVGGNARWPKFDKGMNCNTHFRFVKCDERRETFFSKGAGTVLSSSVADDYHVYGAWWKNAEEVEFYADNEFFDMVKVTKEITNTPFPRPMHVNMVTETYDWQPAPSVEELKNDSINTSYYDWVRSYKLVPVNDVYSHPVTDVDIYESDITLRSLSDNIFDVDSLKLCYTYAVNEDCIIHFAIIGGEKNNDWAQELIIDAYEGYANVEISLPIEFDPIEEEHYKVQAQLKTKDGKVLDVACYDVSR